MKTSIQYSILLYSIAERNLRIDGFTAVVAFVLLCTGIFLLIYLRFFLLKHPLRQLKEVFHSRYTASGTKQVSPLAGLCMALAQTSGVGNIVGVDSALWLGGPGAVFG